jgi:hypothetical protein
LFSIAGWKTFPTPGLFHDNAPGGLQRIDLKWGAGVASPVADRCSNGLH